jgi:glycosyltransferase involved in cell wall biosynthesis
MEDGMKLLALVESPDHVCCRYRIRAFSSALRESGWELSLEPLARGVLGRVRQLRRSSRFDSVILQRKLLPAWQLEILRRCAKRLIFDYDDAVLFRDSYDPRGIHSQRRLRRFTRTVKLADAVIAGNDFLADCALRAGAAVERVHVIPTCVEPDIYPISSQQSSSASTIDLVWIGSSSTLAGLQESRPIWRAITAANPNVRIRIICDRFPEDFPIPAVRVPWRETTEALELSRSQIGVGWRPDDDWSRGKCGLKILQYQTAGLPVVANPVGSHNEMVAHGETGFLCTTAEEWTSAVVRLAHDAELRAQMGLLARRRVEIGYSVDAWRETFIRTVAGTIGVERPRQATSVPRLGQETLARELEPIGNR